MICTTFYSEISKAWGVSFFDDDGSRNDRAAELFDTELEANNRAAELIATEGIRYVLPPLAERIISAVHDMLLHYENLETYTDCEEYRREGGVGALEDLLERITLMKATERDR